MHGADNKGIESSGSNKADLIELFRTGYNQSIDSCNDNLIKWEPVKKAHQGLRKLKS